LASFTGQSRLASGQAFDKAIFGTALSAFPFPAKRADIGHAKASDPCCCGISNVGAINGAWPVPTGRQDSALPALRTRFAGEPYLVVTDMRGMLEILRLLSASSLTADDYQAHAENARNI